MYGDGRSRAAVLRGTGGHRNHGPGGSGLIAATLEGIDGDRVSVRHLHDDEVVEVPAAEVVGVFHT